MDIDNDDKINFSPFKIGNRYVVIMNLKGVLLQRHTDVTEITHPF